MNCGPFVSMIGRGFGLSRQEREPTRALGYTKEKRSYEEGILLLGLHRLEARITRLNFEYRGLVARIELNHAPRNVIDIEMMEQLAQVVSAVEARPEISVVVFTGLGTAFSVGVDVAAHTPDIVEAMLAKFHAVIRAVVASRKITVAAVRGHCLGGGAELAMVCDLVYTTEKAIWGFPEIKLGCFPPVAAAALAPLVGQKLAADLILTGRSITGVEAARIGLANHAVADDQLEPVVNDAVQHLSDLSPAVLGVAKKALYAWDAFHFDKGLAKAEKIYLEELLKVDDMQEGISAFLEKRNPLWEGK